MLDYFIAYITFRNEDAICFSPDMNIETAAKDGAEAMEMMRGKLEEWVRCGNARLYTADYFLQNDAFGRVPALIDIELPEENNDLSVRKNVTLPLWLVRAAESLNINFSEELEQALIKYLKRDGG